MTTAARLTIVQPAAATPYSKKRPFTLGFLGKSPFHQAKILHSYLKLQSVKRTYVMGGYITPFSPPVMVNHTGLRNMHEITGLSVGW